METSTKKVISMWLDDYDNIFSDFDPRPYSNRELSDDFLAETKKVLSSLKNDPVGHYELHLLMPVGKRKTSEETIIKERLHHYFQSHYHSLRKEHNILLRNSIGFTILGFVLMLVAVFVQQHEDVAFWITFLKVIFEPAGWFLTWFGLDQIFYERRDLHPELTFHHKLASAAVKFESYQTPGNHGEFAVS